MDPVGRLDRQLGLDAHVRGPRPHGTTLDTGTATFEPRRTGIEPGGCHRMAFACLEIEWTCQKKVCQFTFTIEYTSPQTIAPEEF